MSTRVNLRLLCVRLGGSMKAFTTSFSSLHVNVNIEKTRLLFLLAICGNINIYFLAYKLIVNDQ